MINVYIAVNGLIPIQRPSSSPNHSFDFETFFIYLFLVGTSCTPISIYLNSNTDCHACSVFLSPSFHAPINNRLSQKLKERSTSRFTKKAFVINFFKLNIRGRWLKTICGFLFKEPSHETFVLIFWGLKVSGFLSETTLSEQVLMHFTDAGNVYASLVKMEKVAPG